MNIEEYLNKNRYIYSGITDFVVAPVKDNGRTILEHKFKTMPTCETCDEMPNINEGYCSLHCFNVPNMPFCCTSHNDFLEVTK